MYFISTHGHKVHASVLRFLRKCGYLVICEHTPGESYAVDGFDSGTVDREMAPVTVSRRYAGFEMGGSHPFEDDVAYPF